LSSAFVDTSVLLAIIFQESDFKALVARLDLFETFYASDLLEAELRSVCRREERAVDFWLIEQLRIVFPPRSLRREVVRVLDAGYVRGADCFHLATALSLTSNPAELTFLTLDKRQRDVAAALGFLT
jgi:predicted nucleic acid-binding protein